MMMASVSVVYDSKYVQCDDEVFCFVFVFLSQENYELEKIMVIKRTKSHGVQPASKS